MVSSVVGSEICAITLVMNSTPSKNDWAYIEVPDGSSSKPIEIFLLPHRWKPHTCRPFQVHKIVRHDRSQAAVVKRI
jgi:hypothetical protein